MLIKMPFLLILHFLGAKILLIEKVGVTSSIIHHLFFPMRKLSLITAHHLLSRGTEFAHLHSPFVSEIMKLKEGSRYETRNQGCPGSDLFRTAPNA